MTDMNTYPIADGTGFQEDKHIVVKTVKLLRRTAKDHGLTLHEDFDIIPEMQFEGDGKKIYLEQFPNAGDDHLHLAAVALLKGEDPTPHMMDYRLHEISPGVMSKLLAAQNTLGAQAINCHANSIVRELRKKVFTPTLKKLETVFDKHPDKTWDMNTAIAQQDFKQAEVIKQNKHLATPLGDAWALRAALYNDDAFTSDAAIIVEPGEFPLGPQTGMSATPKPYDLSWWMALIATGHEIHFPTANEWFEADRDNGFKEIRDEEERARAEESDVEVSNVQASLGPRNTLH